MEVIFGLIFISFLIFFAIGGEILVDNLGKFGNFGEIGVWKLIIENLLAFLPSF